jgi:hypothetical protein
MTVAVNDRHVTFVGNGIITVFPFDFPVTAQGTVRVFIASVEVSPLAYTLDKIARTVTFLVPPVNGAAITVVGKTPLSQLITSSRAGSTVNFSAVEEQLDNIVNAQQELQYNIDTVIEVAATAAEDASDSAATAITAYDLFDDRYLGEKTSLPTVDNDGAPIVDGALVSLTGQVPSTLNGMYVRRSGVWGPVVGVSTGLFLSYRYVATGGQTVFSGADANGLTMAYTPNSVIVTVNGVTRAPNTYTASNGTSVVFGAGLTASDVVLVHSFGAFVVADTWTKVEADNRYWTRALADARFQRIITSPTVLLSAGLSLGNTENNQFYQMQLGGAIHTSLLPLTAGLPDGFSVVVRATGSPSGYQSSYVGGNGKTIYYRGQATANFFLIGNGEVFRFSWFSGLDLWLAECLAQPVQMLRASTFSTVGAWNTSPTAWSPLVSYRNSASLTPNYQLNSNAVQVAAAGIYALAGRAQFSAGAGGGVTGTGFIAAGNAGNANTDNGFMGIQFNTGTGDGGIINLSWTESLAAGELRTPWIISSNTNLYMYLSGNFFSMYMLER